MVTGWEQGRSECSSEAMVILVFHIDNCLLGPYGCWKWDVRAPSQWLISCDVQPEGLNSVDRPPRPSLCPLFEQPQEVGDGFIKSPFDFVGLEKGLLLVPGRVVQSVGHLTRKSGVLGSIPGLATYFRFSFRFFKKGSCQLLAKACARSTG